VRKNFFDLPLSSVIRICAVLQAKVVEGGDYLIGPAFLLLLCDRQPPTASLVRSPGIIYDLQNWTSIIPLPAFKTPEMNL